MAVQLEPGDSLPEADHALRYVRRKFVDRASNQIDGNAFLSRPAEHGGPSFNWIEYFEGDAAVRIEASRMRYESRGRVAQLNVGRTKAYLVDQAGRAIDFVYDPLPKDVERSLPPDPSHAYLANIPEIDSPEGEAIGDLIVHCVIESWPTPAD
jgi:hypothetical protein